MKYLNDFQEEEFNLLSDAEIKKIIELEVIKYSKVDSQKSNFIIDVILHRFENKFYTGEMRNLLFKDLTFNEDKQLKSYVYEKEKDKKRLESDKKEKLMGGKVFSRIFYIWILNTFLANILVGNIDWYIPVLSEITPVIVQELNLIGAGQFRFASQAEAWRTNRRFRQIKDSLN